MGLNILIVEDQFIEANDLSNVLRDAGHKVVGIAKSVDQALAILKDLTPDMVLLDIFLKGPLTGIDLAHTLGKENIPFIYISANSNTSTLDAAKATRPDGFLVKPYRPKDIIVALDIASYRHQYPRELLAPQNTAADKAQKALGFKDQNIHTSGVKNASQNKEDNPALKHIIGSSPKLLGAVNQVMQVAGFDASVLVLGETGVGKEGLVKALHQLSPRRLKPLVRINCAAIPANLVESELFGHERGAFTGATDRRIGKFEQAHGGTIFLDEIGEMPLEVQSKLLRVIQEKELERVGGRTTIKVDVRIVAATNRDLYKEVAAGRFRIDLYYRINVFPITLAPLRERREDIPLLVAYFLKKQSGPHLNAKQISQSEMQKLIGYEWPGNIRELENIIERHALTTSSNVITHIDLPTESSAIIYTEEPRGFPSIAALDKAHIIEALKKCNGKVSGKGGAAEMLQLPPTTLASKMKKLGIVWQYILG